ncbi:MAG: phenylalanine--tRNA ligase subunit beta [Nitrospiria bacterium]
MPTIEVAISDLESLLKENVDREKLETLLEKVKGELKEFVRDTDSAKIELNDTNRPDLWCPEGIVRQIRPPEKKWEDAYPFFGESTKALHRVDISKAVGAVRPYLGACISRGMTVTPTILEQLIQTQEKLADAFGRKRQMVSIGLYRLKKITFPVRYDLGDPETTAFVPLGSESPMCLREILAGHPKGIEYAGTLSGCDRFPILKDATGEILSFPPIINSRTIGEVEVGDSELFVEVTGTHLRMVVLAVNIFAANLSDRGAAIEPVALRYSEATEFGETFQTPYDLSESISLTLAELNRVLGESMNIEEARKGLKSYGLSVKTLGETLKTRSAPYRDDLMHPIDLVEDFAIARGYNAFEPELPVTYTVGSLAEIERFSDALREAMVGFGFEEVVSNILGSSEDFIERMSLESERTNRPETQCIEIENPMNERYALLRSWLLPCLLRVEGASSKAFYPHRIFEVGEVATSAHETATGSETSMHLSAMIAHPTANFSELHAVLEALLHRLSKNPQLEPARHPSFIDGRFGRVVVENRAVGFIGELGPVVLDAWQIGMPTAAFELQMEML